MGCDRTTGFNILKTLFPRLFFVIQIFLTVWRVASVKGQVYWCLLLLLIFLFIDTVYTIHKRKGQEFKWASTSFLAFLIGAIPPLWLLELHRFNRFNAVLKANGTTIEDKAEGLSSLFGFSLPIFLESDMWVKVLQQTFILLLIPVRWILPRGQITRDRLSQILLVYIALGADIIELLDLYDIPGVMKNRPVFIAILAIWTASLIQFVFLLATSSSRKARFAFSDTFPAQQAEISDKETKKQSVIAEDEDAEDGKQKCGQVEVLALLMTLGLQDIPFLCIRLYIMIHFKEFSNTLLFFVSKNFFVIILQLYRMCIVSCCPHEADVDGDGLADDRQDVNDPPIAITVLPAPVDNTIMTDDPQKPVKEAVVTIDDSQQPVEEAVVENKATENMNGQQQSATVINVAEAESAA